MTLRQARKMSDMTQKEVAKKLGISVVTYMKLENNPEMTTIGQAKKLSSLFGISYDDIFFNSNSTLIRVINN